MIFPFFGTVRSIFRFFRTRAFDTSTEQGRSDERHRRIALSAAASILSKLLSLLVPVVTIPLTLAYLGRERYGIWMTLSSITATLTFADLGIGLGLLNVISESNGKEDIEQARVFVSSAFFMLLSIASILGLAYWVVAPHFAWTYLFKQSSAQTLNDVPEAMAIFLVCFLLNMPLGVVDRIYLGYQEAYMSSITQLAGSILYLFGVVIVVKANLGFHGLIVASSGLPLLMILVNAFILFAFRRPWLMPKPSLFQYSAMMRLLKVGSMFFVLQVCVALSYSSDNLVISGVKGPNAVADYALPSRLFALVLSVVPMAITPLWPALTEAVTRNDMAWVKRSLNRALKFVLTITLCGSLVLFFATKPLMKYWSSGQLHTSTLILAVLAFWTVIGGIGTVFATFMNAMNVFRLPVIASVIASFSNLALSIWFTKQFGPAGVAMGSIVAVTIYLIPIVFIVVPTVFAKLQGGAKNNQAVLTSPG